ncbi:hypothetical protein [Collibacillus ludicampi]|uniref:hypothetical protein n=1 Tax=Collibacillus ludicampi TaxID=2771369 RepID=UPI0024951062|nr:hypothetical protein [Collibacillus ludicampi]
MLREGRLVQNMIKCCETTFKVDITRKAYTPYCPKGSETISKVAVSRKALRPAKGSFIQQMAQSKYEKLLGVKRGLRSHKKRSGFWVGCIALRRRGELKVVPQLL